MRKTNYSYVLSLAPKELRKKQRTRGWAMSFVGCIVYAVLCLFKQKSKSYRGICPYFEIGHGWGGFEMGWFFVCSKDCSESTKKHELGHLIQNAAVGGITTLCLSTASAVRYWWRRIFGANTPYDSWWFEAQATQLGTEYVHDFEEKNKDYKDYATY